MNYEIVHLVRKEADMCRCDMYVVCSCMAVMYPGETDWKVIAIDVSDPLAADLNGMYLLYNVQIHLPCVSSV